jgi:hypothetical protein
VALLAIAWLAAGLVAQPPPLTVVDPHLEVPWLRIWSQWDVEHYLRIAEHGYQADQPGTWPFFPLYPLLIRAVSPIAGNAFLAGLLVTYAALALAAVLLHRLTLLRLGDAAAATRAVLYYLLFPASLYTSTAYTEAVYLLLTLGCFLLLERRRWVGAGAWGALVAATRPVGLAIALPIALAYLLDARKRGRLLSPGLLGAPLVAAGLLAVMAVYQVQVGDPLAFLHAQTGAGRSLATPWSALEQSLGLLAFRIPIFWGSYLNNAINLGATLLFLGLTPLTFRLLGPAYGAYTLVSVALPLCFRTDGIENYHPVGVMLRYVSVVFPGFMVLGLLGRHKLVHWTVFAVFAVLQVSLAALFVTSFPIPGIG